MGGKKAYKDTSLKNDGMKILMILVAALLLSVVLAGGAGAQTIISSCTVISSPGVYELSTDIINSGAAPACISISSSNVIFNGAGHTIDGVDSSNTYGVYVYKKRTALTNVTVKNLRVTDWGYGIYFYSASSGDIVNNSASSNSNGIYLRSSSSNFIINNFVTLNSNGINLQSSKNNVIYNNFFNNTNNFVNVRSTNRWNITKTSGINIIDGAYLGGNVWVNASGTGFSNTCTDSNSDGICDSSYTLDSKNIDYLPLHYMPPTATPTNLANITGNFWVNHTWSTGANTDSFNVSVNGNWDNGSAVLFRNTTSSPHGWVNILVAGYNATSHLLSGFISQSTQIPNNPITITNVSDNYVLNEGQTLYIDADYTDADNDAASFSRNFSQGTFDTSTGVLSWTAGAGEPGVYSWQINVTDGYGSISSKVFTVTVVSAPLLSIISFAPLSPVSNVEGETRIFNISVNQTVNVTWYINGTEVSSQNSVTESSYTNTSAAQGTWIVNATAANTNGTALQAWTWIVKQLPPDPVAVAPPVDTTVATDLATAAEFLYTGINPIQTGVAPGTIEARRVAVLRGRVLTRDGMNLSGVNISILSHPEFGSTLSREDGMFDLAVNGGGLLTVNYEKDGYLTAQRQVNVPWQDYEWLPDVVLVQADAQVTAIDLSSSAPIQVAQGSVVSDSDGTRQATLLFPQGTQANMTLPNGTKQDLTTMHVRATEYTVGANGPKAMPAQLPPTSGYTYAVDLSVDEASGDVSFDQPVYTYVDNFLNFSAGSIVPAGYYNRSLGQWIASNNGLVIKILSITNGMADLDVNGSSLEANASQLAALNITDAERQQLAAVYQQDQSLWRVPITHFSPWDFNWPFAPPPGAAPPSTGPNNGPNNPNTSLDSPCKRAGSIIDCQNQELGEAVDIAGTSLSLHYQSGRIPGRIGDNTLIIPLSGASIPASLKRIDLEILVAGQYFTQSFPAAPNQSYSFIWDGKDVYDRILQGTQPVTVNIGYVYNGVYLQPSEKPGNGYDKIFGHFSYYGTPATGNKSRQEVTLWQSWKTEIGLWNSIPQRLGGWALDVHHMYDPVGKVLYLGDGQRRSAQGMGSGVITTVAGNGAMMFGCGPGYAPNSGLYTPADVAIRPDGSFYIADTGSAEICLVNNYGNIITVAGGGDAGFGGDGGPATYAHLNSPSSVAVGSDGSFYIADRGNNRIRKVDRPDQYGKITTVAGNGTRGFGGDGGPATAAQLNFPNGVAVGPDSSLYIADMGNNRIRRVGTDGIITTVAGNGTRGFGGDGGSATAAQLNSPYNVVVGSDGSLYIADMGNNRIRRVGTDGIITTVAGNGIGSYGGDGGSATAAQLWNPYDVAIGSDGSLYISDSTNQRIRRVGPDKIITTVAGNGTRGFGGDGGPATAAKLQYPEGVAVGPDGSLYISDSNNQRIRRVAPPTTGYLSRGDIISIASEDGNKIYIFDSAGKHLSTLDTLTGTVRYNFTYDSAGLLAAVTDGDGNFVSIDRDAAGNAMAIVSPYGQRTNLTLDANGYLSSITNPAGESVKLGYTYNGLLTSMTDPRGNIYRFNYDEAGRLIKDEDPIGGIKTLERTDIANGYSVKLATGMNRNTTYQVERLSTGDQRLTNTFPNGLKTENMIGTNGSQTTTYPDGTSITQVSGPDPRFGMQAPILNLTIVKTPSGITQTIASQRTASLINNDPLNLQNLKETVSINGQTFTSTFDGATKKIIRQTPLGRMHVTTLDNKSRIKEDEIPGIVSVNYTYDARGRLNTIAQGTRNYVFSYDVLGNLENITDPLSRTVGFEYDSAGRVTKQTLPDGSQIQYTYDANGNIISISPPGRPSHDFNYTPVDLLEDYLPPGIGIGPTETHYTYNIDRQLTRITRPDGAAVYLGYDSAGRMSTFTYPEGTTRMAYDLATGNLKNITAPDGGKITYAYDGSLLTDTIWSGTISGSIHRTYDNNFSITSESINGANTVNFQYDLDGLLTQAGSLNLSLDPQNGMINGTSLGNVTDMLSYNSFGGVTAYQAAFSGTNIFSVNYTRDDLGRIIQKNETVDGEIHTYDYTYDLAGRLTEVRKDGALISQYVYDDNGNRLSFTGSGGTVSGAYDNQDRLLQYGTTTYTYTANGELLSKTNSSQTTTYQYDVLGNLRNVTRSDGTQIAYIIDGKNRRIGKKVNGILVQGFLYKNQLNPIAELDGSGNIVSRFIYASRNNVPDYMIKGGNSYRIIADQLGSPRLVVNTITGEISQRIEYDEFGNMIQDTNPGFQPFGFAAGLYDREIKLLRFGARDYDPETGRWTTKDPLRFYGGLNFYEYAYSDPINLMDLDGMKVLSYESGQCRQENTLYDWVKSTLKEKYPEKAEMMEYLEKNPDIELRIFNEPETFDDILELIKGKDTEGFAKPEDNSKYKIMLSPIKSAIESVLAHEVGHVAGEVFGGVVPMSSTRSEKYANTWLNAYESYMGK